MRKVVLVAVLAAIAVPTALYVSGVTYFAFVPSAEDYAHRRSFDAALWRVPPADDDPLWPVRLRMVDDLVASKGLDGLNRQEVEVRLGKPDVTDKWQDWHLVYRLGPERRGLVRIDSEWLVIRFDGAGRVATYRVVGD